MSRTDLNITKIVKQPWYIRQEEALASGIQKPTILQTGDLDYKTIREIRTGSVTPGYRELVMAGLPLPPRAFSYSKVVSTRAVTNGFRNKVYPPSGYYRRQTSFAAGTLNSQIPPFTVLTPALISVVDQRAVTNLLLSIKDESTNIGVVVGERRQTMNLFIATAGRLAKAGLAVKRGDLRSAAKALGIHVSSRKHKSHRRAVASSQSGSVARGWLELQYGWKPLLNDLFLSAEALAKANLDRQYSTKHSFAERFGDPRFSQSLTDSSGVPFTGYSSMSWSVQVRYTCTFTESNGPLRTAKELGFTNPLSLAWELFPFSFLADWALPIGNYLSSLDATLGLVFRDGCKTVSVRRTGTRGQYYRTPFVPAGWAMIDEDTIESINDFKVDRTLLYGFPSVVLPSFKNPLSVTHVANAMALLKVVFGKK